MGGAANGPRAGGLVALVLAVAMATAGVTGTGIDDVDALRDPSCRAHDVQVSLVPGTAPAYGLKGWLCVRDAFSGQTVIIASQPATSTRTYWDWPQEPQAFSFVRAASQAGYAVFNYDRIGAGASDRPDAAFVHLASDAYVLQQIAVSLKAGGIGGVPFGKVVLLGNSYGTLFSIFAAELYDDFDGLVNTGVLVGPHPQGIVELFLLFHPTDQDSHFDDADIPPGYLTTVPGGRDAFFHLPATEPHVRALDEASKDTVTMPEAATFGLWTPLTHLVDVPVLSLVGDRDFLFCRPQCAPDGPEATKEPLFWGPATCFELGLVPEAGHFLQLHRHAAAATHGYVLDWLDRRIGDGAMPATAPCGGRGIAGLSA